MFKKTFGVLVSAAILATSFAFQSAQAQAGRDTDAAARARVKVEKLGAGSNAGVEVKLLDGTKLKGYVSAKEQDSFTVTDRKTGASSVVRYAEVSEVKKSGGGLSTKSWIIIGSVIAGAVVTWIVVKPAVCDGGAQSKFPC
ncbi:MAG: hypothetical protein ABI923_10410 [bacterium]